MKILSSMLMFPGEEGSEKEEKMLRGNKQTKKNHLKTKSLLVYSQYCDSGRNYFFNDIFTSLVNPGCIYAFLIPSDICK